MHGIILIEQVLIDMANAIPDPKSHSSSEDYKRIVLDIDGTLCKEKDGATSYSSVLPNLDIIARLKEYKKENFYIILYTSRQMRTYKNNIGQINANTLPLIIDWLKRYDVPYDEIIVGKPWCGFKGFYVDDKAIRPDEFLNFSYHKIRDLLHLGD
jgi:capsule biosynthesis phosphatase